MYHGTKLGNKQLKETCFIITNERDKQPTNKIVKNKPKTRERQFAYYGA